MTTSAIAADNGQPKDKDKDYEIAINGTLAVVGAEAVTYEQIVDLGFPAREPAVIYSVAYRKAKGGNGTLVPGSSVTVKKTGTSFDVTPTTRS